METLKSRAKTDPFNVAATVIFALAILHTFAAGFFIKLAHKHEHLHDEALKQRGIRDAELDQVVDHRRMRQARIAAPQLLGDDRVTHGQALDMGLVDHRIGHRHLRRRIIAPVERRVHHHRFRHGKGRVAGVERLIPPRRADLVAHQRIRPAQPPRQPHGIGVQKQLVRVEPVPLTRLEFLLLRELMEHVGQSVGKGQLLASVWGYDFDVDTNVVDVFVGYLRRKLDAAGMPGAIETVRGVGYRIFDEATS